MPITDTGAAAEHLQGVGPPIFVQAGAVWYAGDLIGVNSSGAWVRADANAPIGPLMVAGSSAKLDERGVPLYMGALVRGGRYSGGVAGSLLYTSATAGLVAEAIATGMGVTMPVGWTINDNTVFLLPTMSLYAVLAATRTSA